MFTVVLPDAPCTGTCTITGVPPPPVPVPLPPPLQDSKLRARTTNRITGVASTSRMRSLCREQLRARRKIRSTATNSAITRKPVCGTVNFGCRRGNDRETPAGLAVTLTVSDDVAVAFGFIWTGVDVNWQLMPAGAFGQESDTCPWKLFTELIWTVNT